MPKPISLQPTEPPLSLSSLFQNNLRQAPNPSKTKPSIPPSTHARLPLNLSSHHRLPASPPSSSPIDAPSSPDVVRSQISHNRTLVVEPYLHRGTLDSFAALAFTSRTGIAAFALVLAAGGPPPLADAGEPFTVAALGKDAELLHEGGFLSRLCRNTSRIKVLVPEIASPASLVAALGDGLRRRVLCPVPTVVDLEEPPVIPNFVRDLESARWIPVRVPAYETRWAGPGCADCLMKLKGPLDAMVFTSSAEVEGLMKGLEAAGWDWGKVRRRWPEMLVSAHGPVTAKGVERFGVRVDVVSSRFSSFDGILEALASKLWASSVER